MEELEKTPLFQKIKIINWIILIFSTTLFFYSIPTYMIFPPVSSDFPQTENKRNLQEEITTDNCISAITSLEFIDYGGLTLNYSEIKVLGIYQPYHQYEHKKLLSNGSYTYIYNNNSVEDGYETREIIDRYKKIYFYNSIIVKAKTTKFLINEHYSNDNHYCINGYKSCGKVESKTFKYFCVPEGDECPIKKLVDGPSETTSSFGDGITYITVPYKDKYFHYIQYNESDTIDDLYLDFGVQDNFDDFHISLFKTNGHYIQTYLNFGDFQAENNIVEAYPKIDKLRVFLHLTSYILKMSSLTYEKMKCVTYDSSNIPNSGNSNNNNGGGNNGNYNNNGNSNTSPNNNNNNNGNSNTSPNNNNNGNTNSSPNPININYNTPEDPSYSYNDPSLNDYRNKMKNKFETGLFLSLSFNFAAILFVIYELFLFTKVNFEDSSSIFYVLGLLRVFHFSFYFIIFAYEIYLITKFKFKVGKKLFIQYSIAIHIIYIILCLIVIVLDALSFYNTFELVNHFRELKNKYLEIKEDTITQNGSNHNGIISNNDNININDNNNNNNSDNNNVTDIKRESNESNNLVPKSEYKKPPNKVSKMNPYK